MNQSTILKLSKILNNNNIIWGIGGSTLLEYYGLYCDPNDLDLWIRPNDIDKAKNLFKDFQKIKTNIYLPEKYHFKIQFFDIEVDFVACFMIKPNQYKFTFNISPNNLRYIHEDGAKIPITYLEDWYIIYKLLKREDKAKIIEKYFNNQAIELSVNVLNISLSNSDNTIPIETVKAANNLRQLSLFSSESSNGNETNTIHNIYLFNDIKSQNSTSKGIIHFQIESTEKENAVQLSLFDWENKSSGANND